MDNASALPTDPQDQKTKVSVNLIALEAQHSNPVDRQPGQPRHPSPHSVSILAAIHNVSGRISVKLTELALFMNSTFRIGLPQTKTDQK
ncbi:MAG TPA: hypothetical protein VK577_27040, partial [Bradyrhizobium sp.]|nr:hypothetical protein [Bradyrhizobium sp.]